MCGKGGGGGRGVYDQIFNNFNYFDKDKKCVVFYSTLFYLIFVYYLQFSHCILSQDYGELSAFLK